MNHNAKNNSLSEIAEVLFNSQSVLIFPHVFADGDATGSAVALCIGLRNLGKTAWIVIEDRIPELYDFLTDGYCINSWTGDKPSLCVMLDCGEMSRIPGREALFMSGDTTMCIDHHVTSKVFLDWNYIDKDAAATAEIIYDLLNLMDIKIDKVMGEGIFTGIVTDTGRFQYNNTTGRTHLIIADLYDLGIKPYEISLKIFQKTKIEKVFLEARIIESAVVFAKGHAIISIVSGALLKETGAKAEDSEGMVEKMRDLKDIEVSALIKEIRGAFKISLRSKERLDVARLSEKKGGGGHVRAAGYTAYGTLEDIKNELMQEITEEVAALFPDEYIS